MGTSLIGLLPQNTYSGLIKVGNNTALNTTLKTLSDGAGNDLPMQASTTGINFTGTVSGVASGVAGAIQFSNGSAFASDAANLFWDDTNNRLGVGTNAPTAILQAQNATSGVLLARFKDANSATSYIDIKNDATLNEYTGIYWGTEYRILSKAGNPMFVNCSNGINFADGFSTKMAITPSEVQIGSISGARLGIKGSGSTSATTSLLVQNSGGSEAFRIKDDLTSSFAKTIEVTPSTNYGLNAGYLTQTANSFLVMREGISTGYKIAIGTDGTGSTIFYNNQTNASFVSGDISLTIAGATKNVLIGTTIDVASSLMTLASTTKGFLPPRMTTTQKNAIATPAAGLVVYDTTLAKLCVYTTTWETITSL